MSKKVLFFLDTIIIIVLIMIDQFTKYLAVQNLKDQPAYIVLRDILEFDYLENRGVAFGMLQNKKILILLTGILLLAGVLMVMFKMPSGRKFTILHIIFSVIIAGGIGNMIDRIRFDFVVDFISFVLIDFPTFNVADCYIVCATIILFIMCVFVLKEEDLEFISFKKSKENS